jgi:hypothetical protein
MHPDDGRADAPARTPRPSLLHRHRAPQPQFVTPSTLADRADCPCALAVPTPTRRCWPTTMLRATGATRPDLLTFHRAGLWERVPLGGRVPPVARLGSPAKRRAPTVSAHARACTGCASSRRSMTRRRTGALTRREGPAPVRLGVKDQPPGVHRSGAELDLPLRRQRAFDEESARPASSRTRCVIGRKLVMA